MADFGDEFDVGEEGAAQAAPNAIKRLTDMMQQAIDLQTMIDEQEEVTKAAKAELQRIKTILMPDLMVEIGTDDFNHSGFNFKLDTFVSGSLPKEPEAKAKAIAWLEEHGAGGLIVSDIGVSFSRSQHNEALDLFARLNEEGLTVSLDSGVHTQTLNSFARQRLRDGEPIDLELLGMYSGKVVKFSPIKEKKSKKGAK